LKESKIFRLKRIKRVRNKAMDRGDGSAMQVSPEFWGKRMSMEAKRQRGSRCSACRFAWPDDS